MEKQLDGIAPNRQNYEDALEKLQAMIDTAATPPQGPSQETIQKMKTLYVARVRPT